MEKKIMRTHFCSDRGERAPNQPQREAMDLPSGFIIYLAMLFALFFVNASVAQTFPTRPLRLIVPFPPGGTIDMVGRMVAKGLGEQMGQISVVDNRGGAGGMIGVELVAHAIPDGYTLCLCSAGALISSPLLSRKPTYDAKQDFAAISLIASAPYLLLSKMDTAPHSVQDLIQIARQSPNKLNFGSAGTGSTSHIAAALFVSMADIRAIHVPYKGSAPAAMDLFAGHIQFVFEAIGAGTQYAKSGRLRALGVSTLKRSKILPDLPTIAEQGVPGYEMSTWHSVTAPRNTAKTIIHKLNREIQILLTKPDIYENFVAAGTEPEGSSPEQLQEKIVIETQRWKKLLLQLGLMAQP